MGNETEKKNDSYDKISYDNKQMELIRTRFAVGATDAEFDLFLYFSKKYNLDILTKQIYLIKYKDGKPASIFAGRDGFLSIAHRSKKFDSMETDIDKDELGIFAICKVYRIDMSRPFVVKVWMDEYEKNYGQWQKMPYTMLGKVSESQCLRKAFDISGIYDQNEMPETKTEKDVTPSNNKPAPEPQKVEHPTLENFDKWYIINIKNAGSEIHKTLRLVQTALSPKEMTPAQVYESFKYRKFNLDEIHEDLMKFLKTKVVA